MKLYVMAIRHTAFYVAGPFDDISHVEEWGEYEMDNGDDPRWQTLWLDPDMVDELPEEWRLDCDEHPPQDAAAFPEEAPE